MFEKLDFLLSHHRCDLTDLRTRLLAYTRPEECPDDIWLLRFLINSNVTKAESRVRDMLAWRKTHNVDAIAQHIIQSNMTMKDFPHISTINRWFPQHTLFGFCLDGSPFGVENYGRMHMTNLVAEMTFEQFFEFNLYRLEYMRLVLDRVTKYSGVMTRYMLIVDLNHLTFLQFSSKFVTYVKRMAKDTQAHYRECVGSVMVVNANTACNIMWKMVKNSLNKNTLAKVSIRDSKYATYLHAFVPQHSLPQSLGGDVKDNGECNCSINGLLSVLPQHMQRPVAWDAKIVIDGANTAETIVERSKGGEDARDLSDESSNGSDNSTKADPSGNQLSLQSALTELNSSLPSFTYLPKHKRLRSHSRTHSLTKLHSHSHHSHQRGRRIGEADRNILERGDESIVQTQAPEWALEVPYDHHYTRMTNFLLLLFVILLAIVLGVFLVGSSSALVMLLATVAWILVLTIPFGLKVLLTQQGSYERLKQRTAYDQVMSQHRAWTHQRLHEYRNMVITHVTTLLQDMTGLDGSLKPRTQNSTPVSVDPQNDLIFRAGMIRSRVCVPEKEDKPSVETEIDLHTRSALYRMEGEVKAQLCDVREEMGRLVLGVAGLAKQLESA
eukprot:c4671_g1_i1.p1 GENE.c4671_g1_i1~~c4671_g1_i1.p1  ORF type:complete len:610 (+),score=86.87 c4671_g1_i1:44-1873(+)